MMCGRHASCMTILSSVVHLLRRWVRPWWAKSGGFIMLRFRWSWLFHKGTEDNRGLFMFRKGSAAISEVKPVQGDSRRRRHVSVTQTDNLCNAGICLWQRFVWSCYSLPYPQMSPQFLTNVSRPAGPVGFSIYFLAQRKIPRSFCK